MANDNPITAITKDIKKKLHTYGMLSVMTANEVLTSASDLPDPIDLYDGIIFSNTMVALFADTGLGKSIFAVQMAEKIAETNSVLYLDCELSDKQFEIRYRNSETKEHHKFPDNFYRVTIQPDEIPETNFEKNIIDNIRLIVADRKIQTIIIDNITYLCHASEKPEEATLLMRQFKKFKDEGYTIIIIAHTPKLAQFRPITDCDMAGSRRLANFFDTMIAIGRSAKDPQLRYIKQVKGNRTCATKYDSDHIQVCHIGFVDNALRLIPDYIDKERHHLHSFNNQDELSRKTLKDLHDDKKSYREIEGILGISKSEVGRLLKALNDGEST